MNPLASFDLIIQTIAMTLGVSWASGINLYATLFMLGALDATEHLALPASMDILSDPLVLTVTGVLFLIEFVADKVPYVDSVWDSLHTFIRVPAGAVLAAGALGDASPGLLFVAALVGGTVAAGTHATKASTRLMVNSSPEPVSNITLSLGEDVAVISGLWLALNHPIFFLLGFTLFVGLVVWLMPKILRVLSKALRRVWNFITGKRAATGTQEAGFSGQGGNS